MGTHMSDFINGHFKIIPVGFEAWRCPTRDRFPGGPSVFCPAEGCVAGVCCRDDGWDGKQPGPSNQDQYKRRESQ